LKRVNAAWDLGHDLEAYGAVPGVRLTAARALWLMDAASTDLFPVLDAWPSG
jgi:hypothetical protein